MVDSADWSVLTGVPSPYQNTTAQRVQRVCPTRVLWMGWWFVGSTLMLFEEHRWSGKILVTDLVGPCYIVFLSAK